MADVATKTGTFSWTDLTTHDMEGSKDFYSRLFGWEAQSLPAEAGGYTMFTLGGKLVAAANPAQQQEQPPAWTAYISADDADAVAKAVGEAGGKVVFGPIDVMEQGRMAIFQDPTGAFVGLWQGRAMKGADLLGQTGAMCWDEIQTRDVDRSVEFYSKVFGWTPEESGFEGGRYVVMKLDGEYAAGINPMPAQVPAEVPPYWLVYFAVTDCDSVARRAQELGAHVLVPGTDVPRTGRFAVLSDPHGAVFGVLQPEPMQ